MPTYVAHVIKDRLKEGQSIHDVLIVNAPSEDEALKSISKMNWNYSSVWEEGKSTIRIVKILNADDPPPGSKVTTAPITRRRRRIRSK